MFESCTSSSDSALFNQDLLLVNKLIELVILNIFVSYHMIYKFKFSHHFLFIYNHVLLLK